MYCVKCKKSTDTTESQYYMSKNNKHMMKGKCKICGKNKTKFISKEEAKKGGFLITVPTLLAGLAAAGSLAGGASAIANAVNKKKSDDALLKETKKHYKIMEKKGSGLFLKPARGKGLYLNPYKA